MSTALLAVEPYADSAEHLADELSRLDLLLARRAETAARQAEPDQVARAVYITRQEFDWLLADPRPVPGEDAALAELEARIEARVDRSHAAGIPLALPLLGRLFGLSTVELHAVVCCLAPELRRRYDRLYAYLQDDLARKRPSVDLILDLICRTEREKWATRALFAPSAPLLRAGILTVVDDPHSPSGATDLARFLVLDQRIRQFLLGGAEPDARLAGIATLQRAPADPDSDPALVDGLVRLATHHLGSGAPTRRPLVCHLTGVPGAGRTALAAETSHRLGAIVLRVDLPALAAQGGAAPQTLRLAYREALLQQAAVQLTGAETLLRPESTTLLATLHEAIADFGWLTFLTGEDPWPPERGWPGAAFQHVPVPLPDIPRATRLWQRALAGRTADPAAWAAELAARYRLPPARIRTAAALAEGQRHLDGTGQLTLSAVAAACRDQSGQTLGAMATRVRPEAGWPDLVLPADRTEQLREIRDQVRHRHRVLTGWGFGSGRGAGLSVLFSGPPGTGKTMAAEVLAAELDLDLYKVDLSGVVSKYIGETEKNLAGIFAAARASNAVLFFDEADALFGKRTEVSDAHDRYANIETSYLLQQMEEYDGVVVLATNLRQNLDEAFTRRLRFIVEFPFPDADSRHRIWRSVFPAQAPVAPDLDLAELAGTLPVAGAYIRNIAVAAAFLAAPGGEPIGRQHILRAARREYAKIGKLWPELAQDGAVTR